MAGVVGWIGGLGGQGEKGTQEERVRIVSRACRGSVYILPACRTASALSPHSVQIPSRTKSQMAGSVLTLRTQAWKASTVLPLGSRGGTPIRAAMVSGSPPTAWMSVRLLAL